MDITDRIREGDKVIVHLDGCKPFPATVHRNPDPNLLWRIPIRDSEGDILYANRAMLERREETPAQTPTPYDGQSPRTPASDTGSGVLVIARTLEDARTYIKWAGPRLKDALIVSPRSASRLRGFQFNRIEVAGDVRIEGELLRLVAVAGSWLH